ncbi:MAG: hypothetical protein K8R86_10310 [Bacteroidales bacterium]|nr:hypothetical protein [Bacteroidales bacterium]
MKSKFNIKYYSTKNIAGNLFLGSLHVITDTYYQQFYTVSDPQVNIDLISYLISDQPENSITEDSRYATGFFLIDHLYPVGNK